MPLCSSCGGTNLVRVHRTALERVIYADAFQCRSCDRRMRRLHRKVAVRYGFLLSSTTRCIRCGTTEIRRASRRDRVDSLSGHVFSRLMRVSGAPLNSCDDCPLQYYDWRRPVARAQAPPDLNVGGSRSA